mgnify:CR=1 FL=1|jgi:hypothetical protein
MLRLKEEEEVYFSITKRMTFNYNDKDFIIHIVEDSNNWSIDWESGQDKFNDDEIDKIEEMITQEEYE